MVKEALPKSGPEFSMIVTLALGLVAVTDGQVAETEPSLVITSSATFPGNTSISWLREDDVLESVYRFCAHDTPRMPVTSSQLSPRRPVQLGLLVLGAV